MNTGKQYFEAGGGGAKIINTKIFYTSEVSVEDTRRDKSLNIKITSNTSGQYLFILSYGLMLSHKPFVHFFK